MNLVLVESPVKAKTIQKFLGSEYKVLSSYGHIRDLPKSKLGIDIENNFEPQYVIPTKARKNLNILKKEAEKADLVILATDEDREGEAIAWHLAYALKLKNKKHQRITFHEITETAIQKALKEPRDINIDLVDSQQARRILDRLVGYKLSPLLWKKVARGLSAGRVQSVAVRFIAEREAKIKAFKPQEYWNIVATLLANQEFQASLVKKDNENIDKLAIENEKQANEILETLEGAEYIITDINKKQVKRSPLPPFTTSTLQRTAWQRFHWGAKTTMSIAQKLYEKGFITYHRSDSLNISQLAVDATKKYILDNLGEQYWAFRQYKSKGRVQEAHEAIRPTFVNRNPESIKGELDARQLKLYTLIWQRLVASLMTQSIFDSITVDIAAKNYGFRASGQTLKFDGFLKIYPLKYTEESLPDLEKTTPLQLKELTPSQHFTAPPPRYNEGSLIKVLEDNGIGRPSTYAPTLSTIQTRNYVIKDEQKRFVLTEIGGVVNDLLVKHFPQIVDIHFTAKMEEDLDSIAHDKKEWIPVIREFYTPFEKNLKLKEESLEKKELAQEKTDKICPDCGSPVIIRLGRFGKFYSCSNFPKCKYTENLKKEEDLDLACPKCKKGKITAKRTRKGKIFYGCNQYPKCDFALWDKPTKEFCPNCGSILVEKNKGTQCSNKECHFKKL
ncbi:MAG: type I DNA topoisomerase [Patescibacteria group bacterium]